MQLMPETAQRMNVANIFNPRENIDGGVRYFRYLLSLFNDDLRLSLAAYNAGENIVSELRSIPPYRETVDYVRKVLNYYQSYKS
jgi:soluble lytic murein transglycosylase-like protein